MPVKTLFGKTFRILQRSLDISERRHELIASNIANLDTPEFRPRDIDFREALDRAVRQGGRTLRTTQAAHFEGLLGSDGLDVSPREESSTNDVAGDIDKEMWRLAENNLRYRTSIESMLRQFAMLKYAITEGGK